MRDENAVLTVSNLLQDYYGVTDLRLSVPIVVNRDGLREILKLPLEAKEFNQFQNSATILREIVQLLEINSCKSCPC
jgi:L-lactate dehydrogenase